MQKQDNPTQNAAKKTYETPAIEAVRMETAVRGLFGTSADATNNTKAT